MANSSNSIVPGVKLPPTVKYILAIVAVAAPAWFGTVNSLNTTTADAAKAHADQANEKAELSYALLKQQVEFQHKELSKRADDADKRLDKIERKLDMLLGRSHASAGSNPSSEDVREPAPILPDTLEPKAAQLPSTLDAAYREQKSVERVAAHRES
jgi:hypothetical protein